MPIDVPARRKLDADRQLANLIAELDRWKKAAETDLPQHSSQIGSAHRTLQVVIDKLTANDPPLSPETYKRLILSAHRVWDFFQSKFAQRRSKGFKEFLEIADQFAYDCYRTAGDFVKKAPPLVTLSGASRPYVQKRDTPFAVEGLVTPEKLADAAAAATANLPFPVVGMPWSQPAQLEGLVAIGHEVGHAVEDDLKLTPQLLQIFEHTVHSDSLADWRRWQRELFADIWGCLSTGPAFVYGLADYLAPVRPWKEPIDPSSVYPPAWLRIRFSQEVIRRIFPQNEFPPAITQAFAEWDQVYPIHETSVDYLRDIPALVNSLFDANFPAIQKLGKIFTFSAESHRIAIGLATEWLPRAPDAQAPYPSNEKDMRIVIAALRLAYEAAPAEQATEKKMAALNRPVQHDQRAAPASQIQADLDRGAKLFELLSAE